MQPRTQLVLCVLLSQVGKRSRPRCAPGSAFRSPGAAKARGRLEGLGGSGRGNGDRPGLGREVISSPTVVDHRGPWLPTPVCVCVCVCACVRGRRTELQSPVFQAGATFSPTSSGGNFGSPPPEARALERDSVGGDSKRLVSPPPHTHTHTPPAQRGKAKALLGSGLRAAWLERPSWHR
jgi:hypothetical protein